VGRPLDQVGYHVSLDAPEDLLKQPARQVALGQLEDKVPHMRRGDAVLKVGGGAAPSPFSRAFDPVRLPRFVSDGDPDTVTVPAALRDRLRSELPRRLRIVDR
jgi:hypothetical protein